MEICRRQGRLILDQYARLRQSGWGDVRHPPRMPEQLLGKRAEGQEMMDGWRAAEAQR